MPCTHKLRIVLPQVFAQAERHPIDRSSEGVGSIASAMALPAHG